MKAGTMQLPQQGITVEMNMQENVLTPETAQVRLYVPKNLQLKPGQTAWLRMENETNLAHEYGMIKAVLNVDRPDLIVVWNGMVRKEVWPGQDSSVEFVGTDGKSARESAHRMVDTSGGVECESC